MFWALVILPFACLGLAAAIARKGILFRSALVLAALFLVIDALAFWAMMTGTQSTGSIGLGIVGLLQLVVSIIVLVVSLFARKSSRMPRPE
jgi:hypothetical protein